MRKPLATCLGLAAMLLVATPAQAQRASDAGALAVRVSELYRQGRYAEALALAQRALAISERTRGPDHIDVARDYNNLAMGYLYLGRYAEAEPLLRRALVILAKSGQGDSVSMAMGMDNLALVYIHLGRYADAEPLLQRALSIFQKARWPEYPDVTTALDRLASLYMDLGRYSEAEPLLLRALSVNEKAAGSGHREVARALNSLAILYRKMSRFSEAEPLYRRALAINEKAFGPDHSEVATTLSNLATLYLDLGRQGETEPLYKRALSIYEKVLGPNHSNVAGTLDALAQTYRALGRDAEAEPISRRALAIYEKTFGGEHPSVARTLSTLASLRTDSSAAQAEPLYKRVLSINEKVFGRDHQNAATALNDLALLYRDQGRHAEAEPLLQRALAISEKQLGPDHLHVAKTVHNLAEVYAAQARYADALPLVQRLNGSNQQYVALPYLALPVLDGGRRSNLISTEAALDGSLNVAQRHAQTSAAAAVGSLAVRLAAGNDRLAQLVRKEQDLTAESENLDKAIIAAASKDPKQRDAAGEQRIKERLVAISKERAGLQQVFAREFPDFAALSNPLPLTSKEVQSLLSGDEALVVFAAAGDKESYVFAITRDRFDWRSIPLAGETLTGKVAAFRKGLDVDQLNEALAAGRKPELFDLALAHELYGTLFGPVEALVKDKKQLLVVPAGALTALPFHMLITAKPVTARPEDFTGYRDAAWLLKRQTVTVLPSVPSLKALRAFGGQTQAARPMIGFADPVFNPDSPMGDTRAAKGRARNVTQTAYVDFWKGAGVDRDKIARALPQLPDTAEELKAVAQKLGAGAGDLAIGRDATETAVKTAPLSNYRVVYFATHGLVAGDIKGLAEPSLALSIPKRTSDLDDGLLTASEIAQLKLNADWVVLSACNTIAGDKPGAEALSGLARAFFYAGARALLVSHWAVDSAAATRLAITTFDRIKADPAVGRSEALRLAMLDYLNDPANPLNAYPAYWAPFIVVGEGGTR